MEKNVSLAEQEIQTPKTQADSIHSPTLNETLNTPTLHESVKSSKDQKLVSELKVIICKSAEEFNFVPEQMKKVGWEHIIDLYPPFYQADQEAYRLGVIYDETSKTEKIISSIAAIKFENFGYMGCYFTDEQYRSKGYGLQMFKEGFKRLESCCPTIGLNTSPEKAYYYEKSGFKIVGYNWRKKLDNNAEVKAKLTLLCSNIKDIVCCTIEESDIIGKLSQYDKDIVGSDRTELLKAWARPSPVSIPKIALDGKGAVVGFAILKKLTKNGWLFGPLFADNANVATMLLNAIFDDLQETTTVYFDTIEAHAECAEWLERIGGTSFFKIAWMYTNGLPNHNLKKMWARTSINFGG